MVLEDGRKVCEAADQLVLSPDTLATCWRAGGVATIDRLNKYFLYSEMPIISSKYWDMSFMDEDSFGVDVLRQLAVNMAAMLKK